jgi:hypothetical protein
VRGRKNLSQKSCEVPNSKELPCKCSRIYKKYLDSKDSNEKTILYAEFVNCMEEEKKFQQKEKDNLWRDKKFLSPR